MGQEQSIPERLMARPRFWPEHQPRGRLDSRSLIWRWHQPDFGQDISVDLQADVALCFGDVARVFHILHVDDAEFDQGGHPLRYLHPNSYQRPRFVDGLFVLEQGRPVRIIYAGRALDLVRQICDDSGLQKGSCLWVLPPPPQTRWRALPRPDVHGRGSWTLPEGWDTGLREVVANHDALKLQGRKALIRRCLSKVIDRDGLLLVAKGLCTTSTGPWQGLYSSSLRQLGTKSQADVVEQLMENITDNLDDPPLEFLVVIQPPVDALIYRHSPIVVHVQLPPTFPLARERYRVVTPILHPWVVPLVDYEDSGGHINSTRRLDGGRICAPGPEHHAFTFEAAMFELRETLRAPVACANELAAAHPEDAMANHVQAWLIDGPAMEKRAQQLAALGTRWRPALHSYCPRVFRVEVRTLLLARLRNPYLASLPVEVMWALVDALLAQHLASGSLFFF